MRLIRPTSFAIGAALAMLAGCGNADAGTPERPLRPSLTAVLMDRSTSREPSQIDTDRQLLHGVLEALGFGDRIVIMDVHYAGRQDGARRWETRMPVPVDPAHPMPVDEQQLAHSRSAAEAALQTLFFSDTARPSHTDLFASLYDVEDFMEEAGSVPTRIIIFSDMLQSTPQLNMEHAGGIPSGTWVDEQSSAGRLPSLRSACAIVVGAERRTGSGPKVYSFWKKYFGAAGARLEESNYRFLATDPSSLHC